MTAEVFRSKFTSSQKAGEEAREYREESLGKNFHQRVKTVEGTKPVQNLRLARDPWLEAERRNLEPPTVHTPSQQSMLHKKKKKS